MGIPHSRVRLAVRLTATLLAALVALPAAARAQTSGVVTGRVTSVGGEPLQGATVVVVGSQRGTAARPDGQYRLVLPAGRHQLQARAIGYASKTAAVTVEAGKTESQSFELERSTATLERVAIIGTRGQERTVMDAPVPIDVLSSVDIQQSGRVETAQMIQSVAPSFNFPRATIGDGTDHVRPATLRGLAPDQVLVLINGKRRHTSALVNVNGTIGRGSAAVDLNAIPPSMIDHIEILRDGAAAQYGSDAIAGVVNIVLKSNAPGSYMVEAGENYTTYNRPDGAPYYGAYLVDEHDARDGKLFQTSVSKGLSFGEQGFVFGSVELRDRGATNRTLPDLRQQYFTGDPRNTDLSLPVPGWIDHRQGDAYTHDLGGFLNAGTTVGGVELYAFGGASSRFGDAAGFWRRPLDDRTLRQIYPNGFLPLIQSRVKDQSVAGGARGTIAGWKYDASAGYGGNSFHFTVANSANVSLGPTSPTRFDAGELRFGQLTGNLDLFKQFDITEHVPLRVAIGAEARQDRYQIAAGEPDSYRDGGVRVYDQNGNLTTRLAAVGAQVFPGFRPSDAGKHDRSNVGGYVDLESDVTSWLLVGAAARHENYSDFGGTTTWKIASRLQPVRGVAFRGALSTGFRAPSLGQEYFSSTATNFIGGVPFDIRTFPVSTPEAAVLGAKPLRPEKSTNYSAGVALEPTRNLSLTIDHYRIDIVDRIVFSENFTGQAVQDLFAARGLTGVTGGRFFTNAIDTKSTGWDAVANYGITFENRAVLRLTAGVNRTRTWVTHVASTPPALAAFQEALFGRTEKGRIEEGQPKDNILLSALYTLRGLSVTVRGQRFGTVTARGATPSNATGTLDQTFNAKTITDVSAGYNYRRYTFTVGADNVFDIYPDRNVNLGNAATGNGGTSNFGIFPYSGLSPFGFNGRFIYTKVAVGI